MQIGRTSAALVGTASAVALVASGCITNPGDFTMTSDPAVSQLGLADGEGNDLFTLPDVEVEIPVEIDSEGALTYDPGDMETTPVVDEYEIGGETLVMEVTIEGHGGPVTGEATEDGVVLPMAVTLQLDNVSGYDNMPEDCEIGPIDSTFLASSYDTETGVAEMTAEGEDVPAVTTCGEWNGGINWRLGLPAEGSSFLSMTILDDSGNPIAFG